ncbi:MAG: hypothetical protein ACLURV_07965 [Gallintestinimicrobium sp.]
MTWFCEYLTEKIHDMQEVCAKEGITVKTAMFADINGISGSERRDARKWR